MESDSYMPEIKVLLTGFGPFLDVKDNPSWQIVQRLPQTISHRGVNIRLITQPEPLKVEYHYLLAMAPKLIADHSPHAIIHMGLADDRTYFAIEKSAPRDGYTTYPDMAHKVFTKAENATRWGSSPERLESSLDFNAVMRAWKGNLGKVGKRGKEPDVRESDDVGTYACGLLYYTTLETVWKSERNGSDVAEPKVVFFHVPPLTGAEELAVGEQVTLALVKAVSEQCEH